MMWMFRRGNVVPVRLCTMRVPGGRPMAGRTARQGAEPGKIGERLTLSFGGGGCSQRTASRLAGRGLGVLQQQPQQRGVTGYAARTEPARLSQGTFHFLAAAPCLLHKNSLKLPKVPGTFYLRMTLGISGFCCYEFLLV